MAKVNITMEELIYTAELVVGKGMLKWKGVGVGGEGEHNGNGCGVICKGRHHNGTANHRISINLMA